MSTRKLSVREGQLAFDIVSYGRRGPGRTDRLSTDQVEQISRTVRRVSEVMVKVSGGGTSASAVAAHLRYVDRRGRLEVETDDGDQLRGRGVEKALIDDWDLDTDAAESGSPYCGKPGRKPVSWCITLYCPCPRGLRQTGSSSQVVHSPVSNSHLSTDTRWSCTQIRITHMYIWSSGR